MTTYPFSKSWLAQAMLAGVGITLQAEPLPTSAVQTYAKLPLSFEANQGQTDPRVKFLSRGAGYTVFLSPDETVLSLTQKAAAVRMRIVGGNRTATIEGQERLAGRSNYFIGTDPSRWRTDIPNYSKVCYEKVYPGVDLVYYGNQGRLEYDFVVAPRADPRRISMAINGNLRVDGSGDLLIGSRAGDVRFQKPVAYQISEAGRKKFLEARYALGRGNRVGFRVAKYDRTRPLIIDPVLSYSTYLGGSGTDYAVAMAVDASGDVFLSGATSSTNFPMVNAEQPTNAGGNDAFVTKVSPGGTTILYSTYVGGSGSEDALGIALDASGNAYLTGSTTSPNFPLANPFQSAFSGYTAFVTKVSAAGNALLYSTYLGGTGSQEGHAIAVDGADNAYVTGMTTASDFPTVNPIQTGLSGNWHGFLTKFNATGSALIYSTYLGGNGLDQPTSIVIDSALNVYLTGGTSSTNFPTVAPIQPSNGGGEDAFLSKINAAGSALIYSTYLGGSGNELATGIALDASGGVYLSGLTTSTNFPTMHPFQPAYAGNTDAFVTKVNNAGSALVYSTYLGGSGTETLYFPDTIAVDTSGNAYVSGVTFSTDFPTANPIQAANAGNGDAFVTKFNAAGSSLVYSSYLGGTGSEGFSDNATSVAVDTAGNIYVSGSTASTDFPTVNPLQPTNAGGLDIFLTKISSAASLNTSTLTFPKEAVGSTTAANTATLTNIGSSAITINSITSTNPTEFAVTNTCGGSLPPDSSCEINVTFAPITSGLRTGKILLVDSELNSPQKIGVGGTGTFISVAPRGLVFPSETVGTTSAPKYVELKNVGSSPFTLAFSITGTDPTDFTERNNCGSSIAAGVSCTIAVKFTPTTTGARSAVLTVTDSDAGSPQTVSLSGNGT
jgi:hypothetical protein